MWVIYTPSPRQEGRGSGQIFAMQSVYFAYILILRQIWSAISLIMRQLHPITGLGHGVRDLPQADKAIKASHFEIYRQGLGGEDE